MRASVLLAVLAGQVACEEVPDLSSDVGALHARLDAMQSDLDAQEEINEVQDQRVVDLEAAADAADSVASDLAQLETDLGATVDLMT